MSGSERFWTVLRYRLEPQPRNGSRFPPYREPVPYRSRQGETDTLRGANGSEEAGWWMGEHVSSKPGPSSFGAAATGTITGTPLRAPATGAVAGTACVFLNRPPAPLREVAWTR